MPDRDPQLLKGVLPMLVLLLLTEGESYGYELVTRLQADGLLSAEWGRGLVVTAVSTENVTELFELRQALEQQAGRVGHGQLGEAVLADVGLGDRPAQVEVPRADLVAAVTAMLAK